MHDKTRKPFELVHTDLWRLVPITFGDGYKYYTIIVDDFKKFTWIFPLNDKAHTTRAGKTGHRVVFVLCQLRVVSNLGQPKPDPFNNRVKILRPKPDTKK